VGSPFAGSGYSSSAYAARAYARATALFTQRRDRFFFFFFFFTTRLDSPLRLLRARILSRLLVVTRRFGLVCRCLVTRGTVRHQPFRFYVLSRNNWFYRVCDVPAGTYAFSLLLYLRRWFHALHTYNPATVTLSFKHHSSRLASWIPVWRAPRGSGRSLRAPTTFRVLYILPHYAFTSGCGFGSTFCGCTARFIRTHGLRLRAHARAAHASTHAPVCTAFRAARCAWPRARYTRLLLRACPFCAFVRMHVTVAVLHDTACVRWAAALLPLGSLRRVRCTFTLLPLDGCCHTHTRCICITAALFYSAFTHWWLSVVGDAQPVDDTWQFTATTDITFLLNAFALERARYYICISSWNVPHIPLIYVPLRTTYAFRARTYPNLHTIYRCFAHFAYHSTILLHYRYYIFTHTFHALQYLSHTFGSAIPTALHKRRRTNAVSLYVLCIDTLRSFIHASFTL